MIVATVSSDGVLPAEVAKFEALSERWWDTRGPMGPLHAMNPARIGWIDARLRAGGLAGAGVLDVGCGAGIAAEALAGLGYEVLGIDAAAGPVAAARAHGGGVAGLAYRVATAETLRGEGARFAAVTALEVIEHVADPAAFVAVLAGLLMPGGMLFVSTLNRTAQAFLAAKLGAEYLLRMLPVGTHAYRQFVTPAELGAYLRAAGLRMDDVAGLRPDISGVWGAVRTVSVNYIASAFAGQ